MAGVATTMAPPTYGSFSEALEDLVVMAQRTLQVCLGSAPVHSVSDPGPLRSIRLWSLYDAVPLMVLIVLLFLLVQAFEFLGQAVGYMCRLHESKQARFKESFSELLYSSMSIFVALRVAGIKTSWLWPSGWNEVMHDGRNQLAAGLLPYTVPAEIKFYYMMELGWYSSSLPKVFVSRRKKDVFEMLAHHVVTSLLLGLSLATGYLRIGMVVLLLHNAFDPFLHLAKCTKYLEVPLVPDVAFALCAATFFVSRLILYPQAIYAAWSGVCTGVETCPGGVWDKTPVEFSLLGLLAALLPIHCLWFNMILKVLRKALLKSSVQGDVREDTDSDEDDSDSRKRKDE